MNKVHDFLYGRKCVLYTDHQILTYLLSKANLAPSLRNWLAEILEYDFEVIHLPGIDKHLPDALSRLYDADEHQETDGIGLVLASIEDGAVIVNNSPLDIGLRAGVYNHDLSDLKIVDNIAERKQIMAAAHDGFHEGAAGMTRKIRSSMGMTWPSISRDCQETVKSCIQCHMGTHAVAWLPVIHSTTYALTLKKCQHPIVATITTC